MNKLVLAKEKPVISEQPKIKKKPRKDLILGLKIWAVGTLFLFLSGVSFATVFAYRASLGYEIARLKKEINALKIQNDALKMEIASIDNSKEIEKIALSRGMEKATDNVMYVAINLPEEKKETPKTEKSGNRLIALLTRVFNR
ncbi:hypothetical protein CHY_2076 [Carboxydothermus hydrogenoformans Z-2901]|uniref:Cell division protein FtsL n=1 Tax=Carboxydothermus hydrogenoformans (strain ATCC BAA-161 / DSM 6008 / Z-2901) TaxID=246194 RepID=Q3AAD9_CARHZ|nr:hypothetical protein CHY_2076 [Carboxydothermus hydrogenoformans Z-2901]